MEEVNKNSKKELIIFIAIMTFLCILIGVTIFVVNERNKDDFQVVKSKYWISNNSFGAFDLYFLQLENEETNKIYSPLSIKYALSMIEEGTTGESKAQISGVIGNYEGKKYVNSKNMSFANAIFINDKYKKSIKKDYIDVLKEKYNAEVKLDSFATPNNVNNWVSEKTLGLINNLYEDISKEKLLLINALAIDMEWEQKFILYPGSGVRVNYRHENFWWWDAESVEGHQFENMKEEISGMEITASFNNYDIVNELGEENIKQIVKKEFEKYLEKREMTIYDYFEYWNGYEKLTDVEMMDKYLNQYIEEIDSNYKAEDMTTNFSFYTDDNVKVFAKDLKEYDGITLEYIAIMPTNEELNSYISKVKISDINNLIGKLKDLKVDNFKDGVVTKIKGFIPKFKFEYELNLMDDLKQLGITNIFESGKANLMNVSSNKSLYVDSMIHKANIEFTQDGIKAAAVTGGGEGAGGDYFDYFFDVPVEEIDMTFDRPYMFIIRDKNSSEVWFAGTVYEPLLYSQDTTIVGVPK